MSTTEDRPWRRPALSLEDAAARLHELLSRPGGLDDETLDEARTLSEDLHQALPNRFAIERAKGVVMGATVCGPDDAFDRLRRESQRANRRLRDIAEELARTGRLPFD
jgi:hypothetical protein